LGVLQLRNDIVLDFFLSNVGPLHLKQVAIDFVFHFGQVAGVSLEGTGGETVLFEFEEDVDCSGWSQDLLLRLNLVVQRVVAPDFEVNALIAEVSEGEFGVEQSVGLFGVLEVDVVGAEGEGE
jgi:hypothetical protein